jgi:hypothetical protein
MAPGRQPSSREITRPRFRRRADLCQFLQNAENARQQPPINASADSKADVVCDSGAKRDPDPAKWTAKFAFTVPAVTIDLDVTEPPFYSANATVPFSDVIRAFENALQSRARTLGYPASGLLIERCKGKDCGHDWSCSMEWEQGVGYQARCEHRHRRTKVAPGAPTPSIDDFKRRLSLIATAVLSPPWSPRGPNPTDGPQVYAVNGPITYGVLLDRSTSMKDNDPGNRKRRLFFDAVIYPAITRGRVKRLLVASFGTDVRLVECFKQGGDLDQARRCYMREATADGSTDLLGAVDRLVGELGPGDLVWLLTDGMHTTTIDGCPHDDGTGCGPPEVGTATWCPGPKYWACYDQKMVDAGKRLRADGRAVFALFLKGARGNESTLRQLGQIRGSADANRLVPLENGEDQRTQERRLTTIGLGVFDSSVAMLPQPHHDCSMLGAAVRCRDTIQFDVGPNSPELQVRWNNWIVDKQKQVVNLPSAGLSLAPGNPSAVDGTGVTVRLAITDGVTSLLWSPPAGQKLAAARWTVEIDYQVTEMEK